jgi:lipopolysaccharide export system protein LptA
MYLKNILLSMLLSGALFAHTVTQATPMPQQSIEIEADTMILDERNNISTYNGNAILIQGNMRIEADKLVVEMKNKRLHRMQMTGAAGQRASFQQSNPDHSPATAYAQYIEYYPAESRLILLDDAELKQGNNHIKGPRIDYNTQTSSLIAGRTENKQGQPKQKSERVRIVIESEPSAKTANPSEQ